MSLKYADAFCGLGGFSLALKQIVPDAKGVWACDINPVPAKVFKENFGIKPEGDIRACDPALLPDFDILFGGFPCQPFSRNGNWYNTHDEGKTPSRVIGDGEDRDILFDELVKILLAKKPKYFVFENVSGLLRMKNLDGSSYYETILGSLGFAGYDVFSEVLDSADFGLPQQRQRVLFVGIRKDLQQVFQFPEPVEKNSSIEDILVSPTEVPNKFLLENLWRNRKITMGFSREGAKGPNHPFCKGASRLEALIWLYYNAEKPKEKTHKIESVAILYGDTPSGLPRQQDKIYSIKGISPTIATFSTPCVDAPEGFRQLIPRECARLQGIPEDFKLPESDTEAYFVIGNAVSIPVIAAVLKKLLDSSCGKN